VELTRSAETAALAVLEVRVHLDLDWDTLPDDYVLTSIDIGSLVPEQIDELPSDPRAIGDEWIRSRTTALLRVPSWIVPESHNILINPTHPDASSITQSSIRPFAFDKRLWLPDKRDTGAVSVELSGTQAPAPAARRLAGNLPCASFTTSQQRRAIGGPFEDRLDEQDAELSRTDAVQVKSLGPPGRGTYRQAPAAGPQHPIMSPSIGMRKRPKAGEVREIMS
jgi:hypothetical protein